MAYPPPLFVGPCFCLLSICVNNTFFLPVQMFVLLFIAILLFACRIEFHILFTLLFSTYFCYICQRFVIPNFQTNVEGQLAKFYRGEKWATVDTKKNRFVWFILAIMGLQILN